MPLGTYENARSTQRQIAQGVLDAGPSQEGGHRIQLREGGSVV